MKWKRKKTTRVFLYIKYSKFWSVSLEHFVQRKPLISEECTNTSKVWNMVEPFCNIRNPIRGAGKENHSNNFPNFKQSQILCSSSKSNFELSNISAISKLVWIWSHQMSYGVESLFRNKRFALNLMPYRKASKFVIFYA